VHTFPFGQPIRPVEQRDKSPKDIFVLGVYASAVHARWVGDDGRQRIQAVGVATEPEIFWTGEGAADIIARIELPRGTGRLEAASRLHNGPSGRSLDELFLRPLGVGRDRVWLCDLLPESRCNPSQANALRREYAPLQDRLPDYSWPSVPTNLAGAQRVQAIADEVVCSQARVVVTLGDLPLRFFARHFGAHSALRDYAPTEAQYGRCVPITISGHSCELLPLAHPRQASGLGPSSRLWRESHAAWVRREATGSR
jgi:hypothetical protein